MLGIAPPTGTQVTDLATWGEVVEQAARPFIDRQIGGQTGQGSEVECAGRGATADRAAFVVSSPDSPEVQREFAKSRGWRFPMVSHEGTTFAADMGYRGEKGGWLPGVSVFRRDGKRILRVSDTRFHPFDDFAGAWHLFDMLPGGSGGWMPKFTY